MTLSKDRRIEYDIMRILACFGVIMIHAAVFNQECLYHYSSWEYQSIRLWGTLFRWAVPAFVMLSGMMILPSANQSSIPRLLSHRVFRMVIVYIVWSGIYSAYNVFVLDIIYAPTKLKTFLDGCFSGETHMWYLLVQAGLYLISPILCTLVNALNKKWTCYWLIGLFFFSSIVPFIIKLDIRFLSTIVASMNGYADLQFLGGWTLYFVLGYYIQKHHFSRKEKWILYSSAFIAALFTLERTLLYCLKTGQAYGILSYEYPNIYLFSLGILVFFKEEVSRVKFSDTINTIIQRVSSLTFGIYLSHILLLKVFYALGIHLQLTHPFISVPLVSAVVFVSGGCLTWLLHHIPFVGKYIA